MTTTVTVTVARHKVLVTQRRITPGEEGHNVEDVETTLDLHGTTRQFVSFDGQQIIVKELPEASLGIPEA
jgi:hypothetical protein